jgi:hypothetical protein
VRNTFIDPCSPLKNMSRVYEAPAWIIGLRIERVRYMKQVVTSLAAAFFAIAAADNAAAQRGGLCPAETCAPNGGRLAKNTANCSAQNCAKSGGTKAQNCKDWHSICVSRPVAGVSQDQIRATCAQRLAACYSSGCFQFNVGGPRCGPVPALSANASSRSGGECGNAWSTPPYTPRYAPPLG